MKPTRILRLVLITVMIILTGLIAVSSNYVYATNEAFNSVSIDLVFTQAKKLTPDDAAEFDNFGHSVAINGDTVVIGATDSNGKVADSGSAYIFERDVPTPGAWGQVRKIFASDGMAGDKFGDSVSISADTVVVGSRDGEGMVPDTGTAYIFERNVFSTGAWGQVKKIFAGDGAEDDQFGISSSISGDIIVVGARFDDDIPNSSGSAYIFYRNHPTSGPWGEVRKVVAEDAAAFDNFGASVAISGNTLVVGSFRDTHHSNPSAGSAYIFERNHGGADNWGQSKKLIASDYRVSDWFGASVAISGDTVIVGALNGDGNGANTGSAYIYERDYPSPGAWGQRKEIFASDGMLNEKFGISVSISGDTVVVGADFADENGAVYIFNRNEGGPDNWGQVQMITACDAKSFDGFGHSVSISGNTLVAGTPQDNDNGSSSGSSYVFIEGDPSSCYKAMPWIPLLLFDD